MQGCIRPLAPAEAVLDFKLTRMGSMFNDPKVVYSTTLRVPRHLVFVYIVCLSLLLAYLG